MQTMQRKAISNLTLLLRNTFKRGGGKILIDRVADDYGNTVFAKLGWEVAHID